MPSRNFIMASIVVLTTITSLYILNVTFGAAMDGMYNVFFNLTPTLHASGAINAQWNQTATNQLRNWRLFYNSVAVIIIAMGVWWLRVIFVDTQYERQF